LNDKKLLANADNIMIQIQNPTDEEHDIKKKIGDSEDDDVQRKVEDSCRAKSIRACP
jgi:hypothetical protein